MNCRLCSLLFPLCGAHHETEPHSGHKSLLSSFPPPTHTHTHIHVHTHARTLALSQARLILLLNHFLLFRVLALLPGTSPPCLTHSLHAFWETWACLPLPQHSQVSGFFICPPRPPSPEAPPPQKLGYFVCTHT